MKIILLVLLFAVPVCAQTPVANAGPDRAVLVSETVSIDGSGSTGGFDGLQSDLRHSMRWDFGYGGWTYEGGLIAPVAYPLAGSFTVTLTVCNSSGTCSSDTTIVTVSEIPACASEVTLTDSGNPITNLAALQAQVDASAASVNKCVNLPAGWVGRGTLILKHRSASTYLTIRTANHASLPNGLTRVSPSDAGNMAILEQDRSGMIIDTLPPSSTPARYYRFLGLHLRKNPPTLPYTHSFVQVGWTGATSLSQLPDHILFDRCYFDGGSTTSDTLRGIMMRTSDSGVVNSYFHRFKGVAIEVQAILTISGERHNIQNNYIEASTENYLSGGTSPSIVNHVPTDVVIRRNYMKKDPCWRPADPCYYGTNMVIKNLFEIKYGARYSIQGNIFELHWIEDQPGYGIVYTVRNDEGNAPWVQIRFHDFSFNKIIKTTRGLNLFGNDEGNVTQITNRTLFRHNTFAGINWHGTDVNNTFIFPGGSVGGPDRLYVVRNSTDQNGNPAFGQGRLIELEGGTTMTNFVFSGNIGQGFFSHHGGIGTTALQLATGGSYQAIKNGFYRSHGTNPPDNTTVSLIEDVKYTDLTAFNLTLLSNSPFLTTGPAGQRSGPDTTTLDSLTLSTVSGAWGQPLGAIVCKWNRSPACQAQ